MAISTFTPAVTESVRSKLSSHLSSTELANRLVTSVDEFVEVTSERQLAMTELELLSEASAELNGFGVLQEYLNNPEIEEIWVNEPNHVRFAINGVAHSARVQMSPQAIENLVFRLLRNSSRRVDRIHPFADATLRDGSRVHVVIPPVTAENWCINIRKFPTRTRGLDELKVLGMLTENQVEDLREAMSTGVNVLVSGATHAGKTTVLAALLAELKPEHRVVSIEETHELRLLNRDWVAMQGRAEASGDAGPIDLRRLLRESLRMRPDYLVVGEVRGAEALELLLAMNSGIPCGGTIHAKSASAAISKLKLLPLLAQSNLDSGFIASAVDEVLNLVVHVSNDSGRRRISELLWVNR